MDLEQPLTSASPDDCAICATPTDSSARDIEMLAEFAEIALSLAKVMGQQALAAAEKGENRTAGTLSMVVTRLGRSLRQTIAYKRRIEQQIEDAARKITEAGAVKLRRTQRKDIVRRAVEKVIAVKISAQEENDEEPNEDLFSDLYEKLDIYEKLVDYAQDPIGGIAVKACRDLGLNPDPALWQNEPWAIEEIENQTEGSPFVNGEFQLVPDIQKTPRPPGEGGARSNGPGG